ncbi:hypothetical protein JJB07_20570 [Tumebacillus sp. ITR2]|jgi:hypothetical protein|uniref:DUF2651 domain-containing protein n=1 Tax=Tumebacillus amylolyticus TaxID=2801339 RepID=A0ABS1JFF6_9BACL|nr:hypothetical protein [Tumebacillus amylolyticus]MBL0388994.1 hypothetical protein [Tumebacillus amylolyticus]
MSPSALFSAGVILFVICVVIQYLAFHRAAFGRAMFITVAMFFFTGLVYISPDAPRVLVWIIFLLTWAYTLFMTVYAWSRMKGRKGRK